MNVQYKVVTALVGMLVAGATLAGTTLNEELEKIVSCRGGKYGTVVEKINQAKLARMPDLEAKFKPMQFYAAPGVEVFGRKVRVIGLAPRGFMVAVATQGELVDLKRAAILNNVLPGNVGTIIRWKAAEKAEVVIGQSDFIDAPQILCAAIK